MALSFSRYYSSYGSHLSLIIIKFVSSQTVEYLLFAIIAFIDDSKLRKEPYFIDALATTSI